MSDAGRHDAVSLRQQGVGLPAYVAAAWRDRYATAEGVERQARAIINGEAAALRAAGHAPDARTIWLRLADDIVRQRDAPADLIAAAALAGLATGVRPQGFDPPATAAADAPVARADAR